jgi:hypothetical protein
MSHGEQDLPQRRAALRIVANPRADIDYLAGSIFDVGSMQVGGVNQTAHLHLRYVPDRDILSAGIWPQYSAFLTATAWPDVESLATVVFDDLINELVPRWLCLRISAGDQYVVLKDRQPNWDNPGLLAAANGA